MITIPVKVCGDVWCNPDEVVTALQDSDIRDPIQLDLKAEGPSLKALGILQTIQDHCRQSGRDPRTLRLINAPNNQECTGLANAHQGISHFFAMSVTYWGPTNPVCPMANRLALFVGRSTVARCAIMYDLCHDETLCEHFKFSTMQTKAPEFWQLSPQQRAGERLTDWMDSHTANDMQQWWLHFRPSSVDGAHVQDQYDPDLNTNLSLLSVYAQFNIELVCETYTLGDSFFPTEKTVRPLMAARPMLIYAGSGYLRRLRDMGFQSWHELWDESYDDYEGPARWQHMRTTIQWLCGISDSEFGNIMAKAKIINQHNRRCLADLVLTDQAEAIAKAVVT